MERTILGGALLVDGTGAPPVAGRAVVVEDETGRVAPGLAADLLAVAGNPAERVQVLGEVRLELARGRAVVDRT